MYRNYWEVYGTIFGREIVDKNSHHQQILEKLCEIEYTCEENSSQHKMQYIIWFPITHCGMSNLFSNKFYIIFILIKAS